ncbi:MAG: hypothetical protein JSS61_06700 [Verrucomicrobia bacterium]|nr:hypothetical protein [Verrucomicrobiota bacterium]
MTSMHFAITSDYLEYFRKNHYIELEGILSPEHAADLGRRARSLVGMSHSGAALFQAGWDLWRQDPEIKKIVCKRGLAKLAGELFQVPSLRLAFDQYLTSQAIYQRGPESLQQDACLSPLIGALILQLGTLESPPPHFPLPTVAGNGLFVSPHFPIPWPEMALIPDLEILIIGFSHPKTFFRAETRDPRAPLLKKLGYNYGDLLSDALHPLVLRKH